MNLHFLICLLFETRHFLKSCIIFLFVFIYLNAIILGALHMYIVYDTYCVNKIRFNFYISLFFLSSFFFSTPLFHQLLSPTSLFFFSVFTSEICTSGYIALAYIAPPPPIPQHSDDFLSLIWVRNILVWVPKLKNILNDRLNKCAFFNVIFFT